MAQLRTSRRDELVSIDYSHSFRPGMALPSLGLDAGGVPIREVEAQS